MKLVFLGNCQAHALCFIYDRHIGSRHGHETAFVEGWATDDMERRDRLIGEADIVIRQVFSYPMPVESLPLAPTARVVRFPDVRGSFLWPLGNQPRPDNPIRPYKPAGPYDPEVGDRFLNGLIKQGVSPEMALRRYRALDIIGETNLPRFFELTIEQQRRRDAETGMSVANFIVERLAQERLFRTQGHLDLPLFNHLARQVYLALGADPTEIDVGLAAEAVHPFEPFQDAPIHPAVVAHFGLAYLGVNPRYYHLQEGRFTFDEYVLRYMRNDWCPELHEACALLDHPDHERTLALFDAALSKVDGCGHGYEKKSHLLQQLGRFAEAVQAMECALEREPGNARYQSIIQHQRRWATHS